MRSIYSSDSSLLIYYGTGGLASLSSYRRVVLQYGHHDVHEVVALRRAGTQPLVYLSLGEDTGPPAAWQRPTRNPWWGGALVDPTHPGWITRVTTTVERALAYGYAGVFCDTLDAAMSGPERSAMIALVRHLKGRVGSRAVLVNRAAAIASAIAPYVDGFVFEGFSTTWLDGYQALPPLALEGNVERLECYRAAGRPVFALDYADDVELASFARARAATHGLASQVSNRMLTALPDAS